MIEQKQQSNQKLQTKNNLKQNRALRKTLKTLIHRLLHQFRSQSYDINLILNQTYKQLEKPKETHSQNHKKQIQNSINTQENTSIGTYNNGESEINTSEIEQVKKLWVQISIFIWQLSYSPKNYVQMFRNEQIHAEETQVIDMHIFTSKIYKKVLKQCSQFTSYSKIFQSIADDQIYFFLEEVSSQICLCFAHGRKIIVRQVEEATNIVQKSRIINFYVLFKVFKDVAARCRDFITCELQEGLFRNIESETVNNFATYIIEKYEVLKLQMGKQQAQEDLKELVLKKKTSVVQQILNCNNVKWREAVGEDGEIGILVELQKVKQGEQENIKQNYMLLLDDEGKIKVMHCNSLRKKWKVCKEAEKNYDIINLVKNQKALAAKLRGGPTADQIQKMTVIDNINVVGGTMGRTLAQIDQFQNAGQFIATLSQRMIIGGSLNYMIYSVPLLGYIFITGGYTYSFYYIFKNKYSNKNKKMRQIRNMTLGAVTSVGSGLLGAAIGQTLIPVPILGAFIGGFIGGFVGELGARTINEVFQTAKFKETIEQLNITMQPKGYWDVNKRTLKVLEIKKQKFYETIPVQLEHKMNCDRIWVTLIFFTLLTFSQSEKRVKYMEKKLKALKKLQKFQIVDQNMNEKDEYEPSLNILCIMKYFEENHIYYLNYHDNIAQIMGKMFARLK